MTILVLGAGLRGAAACYLAKKAGHRVLVTDKKTGPAAGLAEEFIPFDPAALPAADVVFPATAEEALLAPFRGKGLLYDPTAPALCLSKIEMDDYLAQNGFAHPARFPYGSEPYLGKPDRDCFGRGVYTTEDFCEAGGAVNAGFLVQEELAGPLVSVTVLGRDGVYTAGPVLGLETDDRYDLCKASLPAPIGPEAASLFRSEALRLAEALAVEGIMEVQAVYHNGDCAIIDVNRLLPELSALCLEAAGSVNLLAETPAFSMELAPCSAVCRKNGQLCGRRSAGDGPAMNAGEHGFGNGLYELRVEA